MKVTWLGWAGIEVESEGERVVVDPLDDAGAVFGWLGDRAAGLPVPDVIPAQPGAVAGLLTHLHRDHADADALRAAIAPGAPVFEPESYGGDGVEQLAVAQADHELSESGLARQPTAAWTTVAAGRFSFTALPAVDGTGDPQVSWLIEADGKRVVHLGDTMWHGWWWRIAERYGAPDLVLAPVNGARLSFPHRKPASSLPGAMDPEQAALASQLLRAERLVPMHFDGYDVPGIYEPVADAAERLTAATSRASVIELGDTIEV